MRWSMRSSSPPFTIHSYSLATRAALFVFKWLLDVSAHSFCAMSQALQDCGQLESGLLSTLQPYSLPVDSVAAVG